MLTRSCNISSLLTIYYTVLFQQRVSPYKRNEKFYINISFFRLIHTWCLSSTTNAIYVCMFERVQNVCHRREEGPTGRSSSQLFISDIFTLTYSYNFVIDKLSQAQAQALTSAEISFIFTFPPPTRTTWQVNIMTGRQPSRKTTRQENNLTGSDLTERQPGRKTALQEDSLTGRRPDRKTTWQEDILTGRGPDRKTN